MTLPSEAPGVARFRAALHSACDQLGISDRSATPLRVLANAVFHLPAERLVARVTVAPASLPAQRRGIQVTRWLTDQGYPAIRPVDIEQPIQVGDHVITFWPYFEQRDGSPPTAYDLGRLVRRLHGTSSPPIDLPALRPLGRLRELLDRAAVRVLDAADQAWLAERTEQLSVAYGRLEFSLPAGLIHGDAHPWNLLRDDCGDVLLGDWDHTCFGPREWDIIPIYQVARFGVLISEQEQFAAAYGYDITAWSGYDTLKDVRDLYTLASYLRLAPIMPAAGAELRLRIRTLREATTERWHTL
jgi:aminoglycoside phosphotransferase (APT) family kinase protein